MDPELVTHKHGEMQVLWNGLEKQLWAFGGGLQLGHVDGSGELMCGSGVGAKVAQVER